MSDRWVTVCIAAVAVVYAITAAVLIVLGHHGDVVMLAGPVSTVVTATVLVLSGSLHRTGRDTNGMVRNIGKQLDTGDNEIGHDPPA